MYNHAPEHYLCPFCLLIRSIAHEPTAAMHPDIVYHTSAVTALLSAHQWPKNHGNVIVVPHEHFENIYDLPLYLASPLHELVTMLALALQTVYACEGISTRQHNEPAGNQVLTR